MWYSADLEERAVESIRELVTGNVFRIDDRHIPLHDSSLDLIVIVDFLEHIYNDDLFVDEMKRVLKPGGEVIINVPHIKNNSLLNRIRYLVGLTDEKHGHVRPGYTYEGLKNLLGKDFIILSGKTYSKSFSEFIDLVLNLFYEITQKIKRRKTGSKKGTLITKSDFERNRKELFVLSVLFPFIWSFSRLDGIMVFQDGYKLIVKARLNA